MKKISDYIFDIRLQEKMETKFTQEHEAKLKEWAESVIEEYKAFCKEKNWPNNDMEEPEINTLFAIESIKEFLTERFSLDIK